MGPFFWEGSLFTTKNTVRFFIIIDCQASLAAGAPGLAEARVSGGDFTATEMTEACFNDDLWQGQYSSKLRGFVDLYCMKNILLGGSSQDL